MYMPAHVHRWAAQDHVTTLIASGLSWHPPPPPPRVGGRGKGTARPLDVEIQLAVCSAGSLSGTWSSLRGSHAGATPHSRIRAHTQVTCDHTVRSDTSRSYTLQWTHVTPLITGCHNALIYSKPCGMPVHAQLQPYTVATKKDQ